MGQTVMSLIPILWMLIICPLIKIYRKHWKMQHRLKIIIKLRTIWVKFYCLRFSFLNKFEIENSMSPWWTITKTLCGQYGSNCIVHIVSWLEFARNISKFNIDWTVYNVDKGWSKFTKQTVWISLYCPLYCPFSSSKKSFWWKLM